MLQTNEKNTSPTGKLTRLSGATLMMGGGLALTAGNASADELFDYCGTTIQNNVTIVGTEEYYETECDIYLAPFTTLTIRGSYISCEDSDSDTSEVCLSITGDVYSRLVIVDSELEMHSTTSDSYDYGLDFDFNAKGGKITIDNSSILASFGDIYADAGIFITASEFTQLSDSTSLSLFSEHGPVRIMDSMFYLNYELDAYTGAGNGDVSLSRNGFYNAYDAYIDAGSVGGPVYMQHNWGNVDYFDIYSDYGPVYLYRNNINIYYDLNIMTSNWVKLYYNDFDNPSSWSINAGRCFAWGNDENYCS